MKYKCIFKLFVDFYLLIFRNFKTEVYFSDTLRPVPTPPLGGVTEPAPSPLWRQPPPLSLWSVIHTAVVAAILPWSVGTAAERRMPKRPH